jgi:hypothetical protein
MQSPLRIAFDMDGTLADLSAAYAAVEERLFGHADEDAKHPAPESREAEQHQSPGGRPRSGSPSRDQVWREIEATEDFWMTLKPLEEGAVKRLYDLSLRCRWEVFFVTQRPATAGTTVQHQTHRWLVEHGFAMPNVIPLSGGRGRAASALHIDYLVDDTPQNCIDVLSDSSARAILLLDRNDSAAAGTARRLGIGVAHSVHEALDVLVEATSARANPTLFEKLRRMVGWK